VRRISRGLAERGLGTTVVTHHPVDIAGVAVRKYEVPRPGLQYPTRWEKRRNLYLRRIMREYDVVQIHFLHDWGLTAEIAAEGCLAVTPWGSDVQLPTNVPPPPDELVAKRVALVRMAHAVIATCSTFAEAIRAFAGIGNERVRIVPKGVDTGLFRPARTAASATSVVGYFKGYRAVNGARHVVEAIPAVRDHCPDTHFDMVGDGPLHAECRALAEQLKVTDAIRWLPWQEHDAMPALMSSWSVVAIPSLAEAFCVGALEAAAMALPVVASRVGGLVETVRDGLNGILVPPADPRPLARGIIELLEDPERGQLMGDVGRRIVQQEYEWADTLDALIESYEWAVASRRAAAVG
jgi:glycosyltransferase involved in cell wall biosynthesis